MTYGKADARATDLFTVFEDYPSHIVILIGPDSRHALLMQDL